MKQSLTYYITIFILKLKGLKRDFSKDPIDVEKIRKEDIYHPKTKFFKKANVSRFKISNSTITEINQEASSDQLLLFIHGGAFISGPSKIHWDAVQAFHKQTNHNIWMCDYPKAPENKIWEMSKNIDAIYDKALESYAPKNIILIGDSVGATLITALTQRLVLNNINLPNKIILLSPVMDSSMTNPDIDKIDKIDPMLSKAGILSAKKMCAENGDLMDPMISPLYGRFDHFPTTILFASQHDIMYSDELLAIEKLKNNNVDLELIDGENMPHIWPYLPVMKEAKMALNQIIERINN